MVNHLQNLAAVSKQDVSQDATPRGHIWRAVEPRLTSARMTSPDVRGPDKLFISYSRDQFYFAESLAFALIERGFDVWFDAHRIIPGSNWLDELLNGIRDATAVIVVGSRSAASSQEVRDEIAIANTLAKPLLIAAFETLDVVIDFGDAPIVDFRTHFKKGVSDIQAALEGQRVGVSRQSLGKQRLPYPVRALAAAAFVPSLTCAPILAWITASYPSRIAIVVDIYAILILLSLTYLVRGLIVRDFRRGEFALALVASSIIVPFSAVGMLSAAGIDHSILPGVALIIALPVLTYCMAVITLTYMSRAMYRWLPTGTARESERRGRQRSRQGVQLETPMPAKPTFWLHYHAVDERVAPVIRRIFCMSGWRESAAGEVVDLDVILVSAETDLDRDIKSCVSKRPPLGIITSNSVTDVKIALLSRIQWVDFRRRTRWQVKSAARLLAGKGDLTTADRLRSVPERLNRRVVPPHIGLMLALVRLWYAGPFVGLLIFVVAIIAMLSKPSGVDWLAVGGVVLVFALWLWLFRFGHKLTSWMVTGLLQRRFRLQTVMYLASASLILTFSMVTFGSANSEAQIDTWSPLVAIVIIFGEMIWPWLSAHSAHWPADNRSAPPLSLGLNEIARAGILHCVFWILPVAFWVLLLDSSRPDLWDWMRASI